MHAANPIYVISSLRRSSHGWFVAGVVLTAALKILAVLGGFHGAPALARAWLIGWLAWLAISVGSLGLAMLGHVVRGYWARPLIRIFEAASGTRVWVVLALGFIPIAITLPLIYPWTAAPTWYLNIPSFIVRAIVYFVAWWWFALALRRSSLSEDRNSPEQTAWRSKLSAPGIAVVFLTGTWACFDWMMSIQPDWTSSIYGLLFVILCALIAFSHSILTLARRADAELYKQTINPGLTRDLGNLMLVMLLLWAYFTYSQYIIVWSGDITREIRYFTVRNGIWDLVAIVLIVFGFFGPLFALCIPAVKGSIRGMGALSAWMVGILWLNLLWMTAAPLAADLQTSSLSPLTTQRLNDLTTHLPQRLNDLTTYAPTLFALAIPLSFLGFGGFWRWAFLSGLAAQPLLPPEPAPAPPKKDEQGAHVPA